MDKSEIVSLLITLFGSGGIVMWFLGRRAALHDRHDETKKTLEMLQKHMETIQDGLVMTLENDKVIFQALRTHEINGESEEQDRKMDQYFLTLLKDRGDER